MIPFNKPYYTGKEITFMHEAMLRGKIAGDGFFTAKCQAFFEEKFGFRKTLLTTSCTDALEMAALLLQIEPGDEVIVPSYTFVSSANPFALRGAKIVFGDSYIDHPNLDPVSAERLITKKTKAIILVHYGGISCDMDAFLELSENYALKIVEDAAHAVDSYYQNKALGSFGHLAAFSFHETKNIISGEGGMIVINDPVYEKKAEIIREKGTNRTAFSRGEVSKYDWIALGSSFLPSEIIAAFLYAQTEQLYTIQQKRKSIWNRYHEKLSALSAKEVLIPNVPSYATVNGSIFYLVCRSLEERQKFTAWLKSHKIPANFHYQGLHKSPFYSASNNSEHLPNAEKFTDRLIRLPLYYDLDINTQDFICEKVVEFYS